jgi:hypothetical protein
MIEKEVKNKHTREKQDSNPKTPMQKKAFRYIFLRDY